MVFSMSGWVLGAHSLGRAWLWGVCKLLWGERCGGLECVCAVLGRAVPRWQLRPGSVLGAAGGTGDTSAEALGGGGCTKASACL